MNAEPVLITWLAQRFPGIRVVSETPAVLPVQMIKVVGLGGGEHFTLSRPLVSVECYATGANGDGDRLGAMQLADQVHKALVFECRGVVGAATVHEVKTVLSPAFRSYDNPATRRFGATYMTYLT